MDNNNDIVVSLDIRSLFKRWKMILAFAVTLALLFYCHAAFFTRPSYTNAKVYVIVNNIYAADQTASVSDITASRSLAETYSSMIGMSEMMQELAEYLKVEQGMDIGYQALRSCINVSVVDQTESLRVSVTTGDMEKTRIISEAVESYLIPTVSRAYGSAEIKRFGNEINSVNTTSAVKNAAIGFMGGAILAAALIIGMQFVYNRVADEDEFSQKSSVPLLGVIPNPANYDIDGKFKKASEKYRSQKNSDLSELYVLGTGPDNFTYTESYNRLRTNLMFALAANTLEHKTVPVTSANASECKTTLCANLGVSLAKLGHKVLLIDADMRSPRLHRLLNVPNTYGLSNVLLSANLGKAIRRGIVEPTLDFISAGVLPPNPSELLASSAFASLLGELEKYYDIILVDTPPVLVVTDAMMMSKLSAGVLIACRYKKTSFSELERAAESLRFVGYNLLGSVIVGSKTSYLDDKSRYGYGPNSRTGHRRKNEQ